MAVAERAVWRRVSPVPGQFVDLLHARIVEPYAPHLHEVFAGCLHIDIVEGDLVARAEAQAADLLAAGAGRAGGNDG